MTKGSLFVLTCLRKVYFAKIKELVFKVLNLMQIRIFKLIYLRWVRTFGKNKSKKN